MKNNESDLEYLRRLKGQLIISETGLKSLIATYKDLDKTINDLGTSSLIADLLSPLTRIALNCESQIKLVDAQIDQEELFPQNISKRNRLILIFFNGGK